MNRFRRYLAGGIGVALLAFVLALTPAGPVIAQNVRTMLVEVVNVPDVNVANSPRVQSVQSGSWNVGVNGPVTVGNAPTNPVPVLDIGSSARQAFRARLFCGGAITCTDTLTVPTGKLLVIETYSANCGTDTITTAVRSSIEIPQPLGFPNQFFFPLELSIFGPVGLGGLGRHHEMASAVRLYADPGTEVSFHFRKNPAGAALFCEASISGLLLDCGAGPACAVP